MVFASNFETEGADLPTIDLPASENQLISAVAAANPDTVVVLNTGSAVTMPWLSQVKGVVEAWYPGQDDGDEIAAVLFGDVNPSGKLPVTFPRSLGAGAREHRRAVAGRRRHRCSTPRASWSGYRWYTTKHITPLFPFGYGLSYTSLRVLPPGGPARAAGGYLVSADVTNTGLAVRRRRGPAVRRRSRVDRRARRAAQGLPAGDAAARPDHDGSASPSAGNAFAWWNRGQPLDRHARAATPSWSAIPRPACR